MRVLCNAWKNPGGQRCLYILVQWWWRCYAILCVYYASWHVVVIQNKCYEWTALKLLLFWALKGTGYPICGSRFVLRLGKTAKHWFYWKCHMQPSCGLSSSLTSKIDLNSVYNVVVEALCVVRMWYRLSDWIPLRDAHDDDDGFSSHTALLLFSLTIHKDQYGVKVQKSIRLAVCWRQHVFTNAPQQSVTVRAFSGDLGDLRKEKRRKRNKGNPYVSIKCISPYSPCLLYTHSPMFLYKVYPLL